MVGLVVLNCSLVASRSPAALPGSLEMHLRGSRAWDRTIGRISITSDSCILNLQRQPFLTPDISCDWYFSHRRGTVAVVDPCREVHVFRYAMYFIDHS